jgi:hypothetical protein
MILTIDDKFTVRLKIKNLSKTIGKEVICLYCKNLNNSERDFKELRQFTKVEVAGKSYENLELSFKLEDLRYSLGGKWIYDKGEYEISLNEDIVGSIIVR